MTDDDVGTRLDALDRRLEGLAGPAERLPPARERPSTRTGSRTQPDPPPRVDEPPDQPESEADWAERVGDLEARVQALEGVVGELEAVNDRVRARADAALARTAERPDQPTNEGEVDAHAESNVAPADSRSGRSADRPRSHGRAGTESGQRPDRPPADVETDWPGPAEIRSRGLLSRLLDRW